jgi:2-C-methyl-D-erythritol 2,4-cyclodiphosphate synthase
VDIRIGSGYDVHRLVTGRPLILGGVTIPFEKGLEGHSDADVLLHAIMDALLGAAGLPDIGQQFPNTDERYRNANSGILLARVLQLIRESGFAKVINVDATILAEQPKIAPHIAAMKKEIAEILCIEQSQINIKATTMEKLGFIGREEGIAAQAVCLIAKQ